MEIRNKKETLIANVMLVIAAVIWGTGSVFQKVAADYVGPLTFYGLRSILGSTILLGITIFSEKTKTKNEKLLKIEHVPYGKAYFKRLLTIAPLCALVCIFGNSLVQVGIRYTTAGKAGFLQAIYIVFVPILSLIIFKKKVSSYSWIGTGIAIIGLYFLCISGDFSIGKGDFIVLCCTIPVAFHIQLVSKYVRIFNPIHFTLTEFATASVLCTTVGLLFEETNWEMYKVFLPSILFCGFLGIGLCYALQSVAQKHTNPTIAALLMSLESVFSALAGMLFLHESFTLREFFGVLLICLAIILAQLPSKEKK